MDHEIQRDIRQNGNYSDHDSIDYQVIVASMTTKK